MTNYEEISAKLIRSARTLVRYFGQKFQVALTLLNKAPAQVGPEHIVFGRELQERGLWGLAGDRELSNEERGEVAGTFTTILFAAHRKPQTGGVGEAEARLRVVHQATPENVISMTEARRRRRFPAGEVVGPDARRTLKRDCLIESLDVREVHKLAFELHAHGSRRVFVQLADVDPQARVCFTSLLNLGPVTLFVPEILALSADEQRALATLMDFHHGVRPLVIVGSRSPIAELRACPGLDPDLVKALASTHIQLFGAMNRAQDLGPWLDQLEREDA